MGRSAHHGQPDHRIGSAPRLAAGQRPHRKRRVVSLSLGAVLVLSVVAGPSVPVSFPWGLGGPREAHAKSPDGVPNLFDPARHASSVVPPPPTVTAPASPAPPSAATEAPRTTPLPWPPETVPIDLAKGAHFSGANGRLELNIPEGAVAESDWVAAGGIMSLKVQLIRPGAGSSAGGSGHISYGTYLIQLLDAQGRRTGHGLRRSMTARLHPGSKGGEPGWDTALVVLNGGLPTGVELEPLAPADTKEEAALSSGLGAFGTEATRIDEQMGALEATVELGSDATIMEWASNADVAVFGNPDPANVGINAGALTLRYPIEVPAGPGGLAPRLALTYSSAALSEQHNWQGAAPWVGEGWSLSLGSISWAQRNVNCYPSYNCGTPPYWHNVWQLSDAFGTAAELIPAIDPSKGQTWPVSTFCDSTAGQTPMTPAPVRWRTAPETRAQVWMYRPSRPPAAQYPCPVGSLTAPPCFRVFLPNGLMEEFGCTTDSVQFYPFSLVASTGVTQWLLDLITDPQGNQIHVTYQWDTNTLSGLTYPRDAVMATVGWDSPGCRDRQVACTTTWQPQMQVTFVASHAVAHAGPGGICPAQGNLRCDDPQDLTPPSGEHSPRVQSTFVLNDIKVQTSATGSPPSWNTVRTYQLSYDQTPPTTITDPVWGKSISTAGKLVLTQLRELGADGTTALPTSTFGYIKQSQYYVDSFPAQPPSPPNCGPSWNGAKCWMWSDSRDGNGWYLTSLSNGLGLARTFTWANARNNTYGVPGGGDANNMNPFFCNDPVQQGIWPCPAADLENWSRLVLTADSGTVKRSFVTPPAPPTSTDVTSTTSYGYTLTKLVAPGCSQCPVGMYWGDRNDWDYLDFYNGHFMGFSPVTVTRPDGAREKHQFYTTMGWGVYDTTQVSCQLDGTPPSCTSDPWWDLRNAAHGRETQLDVYDTDGLTLLRQTKTLYEVGPPRPGPPPLIPCLPDGVPYTQPTSFGDWNKQLISNLDHFNPVAVCDVRTKQVDEVLVDGGDPATAPHRTTTYTYDTLSRVIAETRTSNDGGAPGSPTTIVTKTGYIWNDTVTATATSATGIYIIDRVAQETTEDSLGNLFRCTYTGYDGEAPFTGPAPGPPPAPYLSLGQKTQVDRYTNCATFSPLTTFSGYDTYGNLLASADPDAMAGNPAHATCFAGLPRDPWTECFTYDLTFQALPLTRTNALAQEQMLAYTQSPAGGFGLWPTASTDPNGQTTSFAYDGLGRQVGRILPGETVPPPPAPPLLTEAWTYTVWCTGAAAQIPCAEVDHIQRLNDATTVTSRAFYDGWGHLVETRSPAPGGQDVVRYLFYDAARRPIVQSVPYFVTAYTGGPGPNAFSPPDTTKPGTTTTYDGLGRVTSSTDPLSNKTTTTFSVACGPVTGDTACYEQTLTADALKHQGGSLVDAFRRTTYVQRYTGSAPPYSLYATSAYTYDFTGQLTQILHPNGTTKTTFTYDMAGRKTGMSDPDAGTSTYGYDANGNLILTVDARGAAAGRVVIGYDGLDRPIWRNIADPASTPPPPPPYVQFTYDLDQSSPPRSDNQAVGRLTKMAFNSGPAPALAGSRTYVYDQRGRVTSTALTVGAATYGLQTTYDDAGTPLTQTYPTGEVVTTSYSPEGWAVGLSTQLQPPAGPVTSLLSNATYTTTDPSGAVGPVTAATLAGGAAQYAAQYDAALRPTSLSVTRVSPAATLFSQTRSYDGAYNVTAASTTMWAGNLGLGTDQQAFCYDEQDRLTWAGSTGTPPGTPPCTAAPTPGTIIPAFYTHAFTYDTLGRLASGPQGAYTYGDPAHLHGATAIGTDWTARYDAAGNMTCRAPSSATTCVGATPTGNVLTYNNEGVLSGWQDAPTSPTLQIAYLTDGKGERVAQQQTQGGTTTTTVYVDELEEITTSGTNTTKTTKYYFGGARIAVAVKVGAGAPVFSYLASDALGSTSLALDDSGAPTASALYVPYGSQRFTAGALPTAHAFTGQLQEGAIGLYYFHARYYEPQAGQFISADPILPGKGFDLWGLSRYAYVAGNPIGRTDPSGLGPPMCMSPSGCYGGGGDPLPDPPKSGGGGGVGPPSGGGGYTQPPPPPRPSWRDRAAFIFKAALQSWRPPYWGPPRWGRDWQETLDALDQLYPFSLFAALGGGAGRRGAKEGARAAEGAVVRAARGSSAVKTAAAKGVTKVETSTESTASTRWGRTVQEFQSNPGEWTRASAHAEAATAKIYRGGTSIEEIFTRGDDDWLVRHRIYGSGGDILHETYRPYAKFGAP